jgi:hypothetical protein
MSGKGVSLQCGEAVEQSYSKGAERRKRDAEKKEYSQITEMRVSEP